MLFARTTGDFKYLILFEIFDDFFVYASRISDIAVQVLLHSSVYLSNGLAQWFSTFLSPSPGKMIFLFFVPVTNSLVANCPSNIIFNDFTLKNT